LGGKKHRGAGLHRQGSTLKGNTLPHRDISS
jgi:hypothetical protein